MQDSITKDIMKAKYLQAFPYLKQERAQKFVGLILTLLTLSFFGFFAINPTISTILQLQKELSDRQFVYEQLEVKIKNLAELKIQYNNLQNDLPIILNSIPTVPDAPRLFAQIQTIAGESNISLRKLESFETDILNVNKDPEKKHNSYSFSISGTGSNEDIYSFVSKITNMQRIINAEIFSISNPSGQNEAAEFNIQATAFFKE